MDLHWALDLVRRCQPIKASVGFFCIVFLASPSLAQAVKVDSSLPSYRPVSGVVGVVRGHSTGLIHGQSSRTRTRLIQKWATEFRRIYPKVRVTLDDSGIEDVRDHPAVWGPWLGELHEFTRTKFKKRFGAVPTSFPVCWYVLAVYVHKDCPVRKELRMKELETIYSAFRWDATWGDLGCKGVWFNRHIRLYAPGPFPFVLKDMVARHCEDPDFFWFKDTLKSPFGDAGVVRSVASDPHGMGLASIGIRSKKIRALSIARRGSTSFVSASAQNAYNGSYPLAAQYYLHFRYDPEAGIDLPRREFLRYIVSKEGQQAVVKEGFTPLTATFAKRALAQLGLVHSGEDSPWNQMLIGLRLRDVPADLMERIERCALAVGSKTTDTELLGFTKALGATFLRSTLLVECEREGATIRYRPVCVEAAQAKTAKKGSARLRIGIYHIWTEREGRPTSPKNAYFQIVREKELIKIRETR